MRFFDLHCDTITKCVKKGKGLRNNSFHVDLDKIHEIDTYIQCVAFWNVDSNSNEQMELLFNEGTKIIDNNSKLANLDNLKKVNELGGVLLIPTVENSCSLMGNIEIFKNNNIKMASLTWNGDNKFGSGTKGTNFGITEYGKSVLKEFEENNIVIDVSHASEKLFWDICENTEKEIVASHSNAFNICKNERNLKDNQIKEIVKRKSLIGINFYRNFLNEDFENATTKDILIHCEYMLSLGCKDVLAMGSDFDGSDMPAGIDDISSIPNLYEEFLKIGYSESLVDKIFYKNAYDFFVKKNSV